MNSIIGTINVHLNRYPMMEAQDVYKLIYQASMGMRHLFLAGGTRKYFDKEYNSVEPRDDVDLFTTVHPDDELFRINLARAKREGIPEDLLWEYLIESALAVVPDKGLLKMWWYEFVGSSLAKRVDNLESFEATLAEQGFVLFHHSDIYRRAYNPSYRLVTNDIAQKLAGHYILR